MPAGDKGLFVLSLDFELFWGVRDHRTLADYRENLLGVRQAIPQMLELFRRFDAHATWATVGLLFFENKQQMLAGLPSRQPAYANARLSPYPHLDLVGDDETADAIHFGASLIRLIQATPGQELATHTFGHYYCLEAGQTVEDFEADLAAARRAAQRFGVELKSLVFPRNQWNAAYLDACRRAGIRAYRGNQRSFVYEAGDTASSGSLVRRALRLTDAYLPVISLSAASLAEIAAGGEPYNVPASRFLRPYSAKFAALEGRRLRRIEQEMTAAARAGRVYHLWWHPHNFGANTRENLANLERLLRHFDALRREHGMASLSMGEIAERLSATPALAPAAQTR
jgi:peptidoglycan/xylan/chitin deacetylase (PgdA/CDA1 family)